MNEFTNETNYIGSEYIQNSVNGAIFARANYQNQNFKQIPYLSTRFGSIISEESLGMIPRNNCNNFHIVNK